MPGPCDTLDFGEFEDFLINITPNLTGPGGDDTPRGTAFQQAAEVWFGISPNPAGDFAIISMDKLLEKPAAIRVTDIFGKIVFSESTTRVAQSVMLLESNWPSHTVQLWSRPPPFTAVVGGSSCRSELADQPSVFRLGQAVGRTGEAF